MELPQFDDNFEVVKNLPCATLGFTDGDVVVSYEDTWVRKYKDPQFDHVEQTNDEGFTVGMRVPPETIERLSQIGFRTTIELVPNPSTFEWLVMMIMRDVEDTIPEGWSNDAT